MGFDFFGYTCHDCFGAIIYQRWRWSLGFWLSVYLFVFFVFWLSFCLFCGHISDLPLAGYDGVLGVLWVGFREDNWGQGREELKDTNRQR
jgi:hypothetical protein